MSDQKPNWRLGDLLGRAAHTDPHATVVPLRRQSFEQLAAARQRALDERNEITTEQTRLENAYAAEMDRMADLLRKANDRLRASEDQIRMMLAELGIAAQFIAGANDDRQHSPNHDGDA